MVGSSSHGRADIERNGEVIATRAAAQAASVGVLYEVNTIWGRVPEVILHQAADCQSTKRRSAIPHPLQGRALDCANLNFGDVGLWQVTQSLPLWG
jgi:hypothetical protein